MYKAEIIEIDAHTLRIENEHVRAFLLEGTKKSLLIDTCLTLPHIRSIAEGLTDLPLSLLNTHADPDHISGNSAFECFYMHALEEDNYRKHGGTGRIVPVRGGDVIDLGDRHLEVIEAFGHTPGSIMLLDIEDRSLYAGDAIQDGEIFMFGERRNMSAYAASLKALSVYTSRFDRIYPAHGPLPLGKEVIPMLIRDAETILNGRARGTIKNVFGRNVICYRMSGAAFLCDEHIDDI